MTISEILKSPDTLLVDVRTPPEYQMGHINGAINIPLDQIPYRYSEIPGLGSKNVVFYCRSGNRSGQAIAYLRQLKIENIYNGGGIDDVAFYLN